MSRDLITKPAAADAGYASRLAAWTAGLKITLEMVRKRDRRAFGVLPRYPGRRAHPAPGSPCTATAHATTSAYSRATRPVLSTMITPEPRRAEAITITRLIKHSWAIMDP
jgi:hypothetical protein